MQQGVSFLIHGPSKSGKSYFSDTSPAPRLILDAEGGASSRFTSSQKVLWDPVATKPPEVDGTWDTAVVYIRSFLDLQRVYDWLVSGQHPFQSVSIDSISEAQQRCIDAIVGVDPMQTQHWGELLRKMSDLIRKYRDLIIHPTNPLQTVTFIAMTRVSDGRSKPFVQGQLAAVLPYYVDICGYLWTDLDADTGELTRRLLVGQHAAFEAGDRTGKLGNVVTNPTIPSILQLIYS